MSTRRWKAANGLVLRTFDPPSKDLRFQTLSAPELKAFGAPDLSQATADSRERWVERFRRYEFAPPKFRSRKSRRTGRPILRHGNVTSSIWAGGILMPNAAPPFTSVDGSWAVPAAALPDGDDSGTQYCASSWIGLDGDGSGDVLQAGCDADVQFQGGGAQHTYRPWWEWYPAGSFWITNLAVSGGDVLESAIHLQPGSLNSGTIFLANKTTGQARTFAADAPAGTSLAGNCAEWIVEAYGSLGPLARFGAVTFSECIATQSGGASVQSGAGFAMDMTDPSGAVVASAALSGSNQVVVNYE